MLAGLGMRDLFDDVIGGDGPYPRKPDPAALRALMERAGATPERTLMVGDSQNRLRDCEECGDALLSRGVRIQHSHARRRADRR